MRTMAWLGRSDQRAGGQARGAGRWLVAITGALLVCGALSSPSAAAGERAPSGAASRVRVGGATLYGSVSLSDGRPALGATVTASVSPRRTPRSKKGRPAPASAKTKSPPAAPALAKVGADGRYAFEHLPPGRYLVTATDKRHQDSRRFAQLQEGGSEKLDLVLEDAATIAGHVRDPGGAPLAGIQVSSSWPKREAVTGIRDGETTKVTVTLPAQGR